MIALIKVKQGPRHKKFVQTANQWGITLKATSGVEDWLYFVVREEEDVLISFCKTTHSVLYPISLIEERKNLRTANYQNIYGDVGNDS